MSYTASLLTRDFQPMLAPFERLIALELSWSVEGGCQKAELLAQGVPSFEIWGQLLGQPVEVRDGSGQLIWWGYLDQAQTVRGGVDLSFGLNSVANRVAVSYEDFTPGSTYGQRVQTDWVQDLPSQAVFGIKEKLVVEGALDPASALQRADLVLINSVWPRVLVETNRSDKQAVGDWTRLTCRGWFDTLDWRVWPGSAGIFGHSPAQLGQQILGDAPSRIGLAVSFMPPASLDLASASLRLRKQGMPADGLNLQVQTDSAGLPSGVVLAEASLDLNGISQSVYSWAAAAFSPKLALDPTQTYWLVTSRTGSLSASQYYVLAVDENLGNPGGEMLIYDQTSASWKARLPDADLLFKLTATRATGSQMLDIAVYGGQFLSGSYLEGETGLELPPREGSGETCLQALQRLMHLGSADQEPILAWVSPARELSLSIRPNVGGEVFWLDEEGRLLNLAGCPLLSPAEALGNWARTCWGGSIFIGKVTHDLRSGKAALGSR